MDITFVLHAVYPNSISGILSVHQSLPRVIPELEPEVTSDHNQLCPPQQQSHRSIFTQLSHIVLRNNITEIKLKVIY